MSWTLDDFLLDQTYCDDETLSAEFTKLAAELSDSQHMLLVVADGRNLFETLALSATKDSQVWPAADTELGVLVNHLSRDSILRALRLYNARLSDPRVASRYPITADERSSLPPKDREALSQLSSISSIATEIGNRTLYPISLQISRLSTIASHSLIVGVLKLDERATPPRSLSIRGSIKLNKLHRMCACTPYVHLQRDRQVRVSLDQLILDFENSGAVNDNYLRQSELERGRADGNNSSADHRALESLVRLAIDAVSAKSGCIYLQHDSDDFLRRVGQQNCRLPDVVSSPSRYWLAYRRGKYYLQERNLEDGPNSGQPITEAIVPIPITSSTGETRHLGVLVVSRLRNGDGQFTANDLTLLRNVALRVAQYWEGFVNNQAISSLANITASAKAFDNDYTSDLPASMPFNVEMRLLADQVQSLLEDLRKYTRSRVVELYVIDRTYNRLRRLSASPRQALQDKNSSINLTVSRKRPNYISSVNAWVYLTGQSCYLDGRSGHIDSYDGLAGPAACRANMQSELTIPIEVDGLILGTLNLESERLTAYSETTALVRVYAEQIRQMIKDIRWQAQFEAIEIGHTTAAQAHTIRSTVEEILNLEAPLDTAEVREKAQRIARMIERRFLPESHDASPATLTDLIEASRVRLRLAALDLHLTSDKDVLIPQSLVDPLQTIVDEIVLNGIEHSSNRVEVDTYESLMGGSQRVTIEFSTPSKNRPSRRIVERLYRTPIRVPSRRSARFGAFAAGTLMRSLGGDVTLAGWRGNITVKVVLPPSCRVGSSPRFTGEEAKGKEPEMSGPIRR